MEVLSLARKEENGKIELVEQGMHTFLKYMITALAISARWHKAASLWLDKIFAEKDEAKRLRIEREWVCKYVLIHPISSPTTIIWGHGEGSSFPPFFTENYGAVPIHSSET
jgi:hypothetical protein